MVDNVLDDSGIEAIFICGDFNASEKHPPIRMQSINNLCKTYDLHMTRPIEMTNHMYNGSESSIDFAIHSKDMVVSYEVLDSDKAPLNLSTHDPISWSVSFKKEKEDVPRSKDDGDDNKWEGILSKHAKMDPEYLDWDLWNTIDLFNNCFVVDKGFPVLRSR